MISIVGIVVVFGAVIGGFLMEKGQLAVLIQPAEVVTIVGAALGTLLVANPVHVLKGLIGSLVGVLSGSPYNKQRYLDTLKMMFDLSPKPAKKVLWRLSLTSKVRTRAPFFPNIPSFSKTTM